MRLPKSGPAKFSIQATGTAAKPRSGEPPPAI